MAFIFLLYIVPLCVFLYYFLKCDSNLVLAICEKYFPNKEKLRNKTVWIIGCSTGIGEQLALQLAELNCRLILTSTTQSKLEKVAEECIKRSKNSLRPDDILVLAYDVSKFEENDVAFKKIIDKFGNVDVVINNQGRIFTCKILEDTFELTRKIFDINYFANVYITKLVIEHWLAINSKGQILVTSSLGSYFSFLPFFNYYLGTKLALNAFYRDVALQHQKDGIYVSLVLPGTTKTDLEAKSFAINKRKTTLDDRTAMTAERVASLSLIALSNKLHESWIAFQPLLLFACLSQHFGHSINFLCRFLNLAKLAEKKILK